MFLIPNDENNEKYNEPIYGMVGEYTLSEGVSLPYFLALLPIERAIEELSVAESLNASIDAKWSLQELFQREIDQQRVEREIIRGYLLDPQKLKFFNALTIVLMPKGQDDKILDVFEDNSTVSPPIPWKSSDTVDSIWEQDGVQVKDFGGIQFATYNSMARLRWDFNKILAVAVDGQHRLWALRTYKEESKFRGGILDKVEKKTKIPVIFVLLHKDAGFQTLQDGELHSIRTISRELFTDLNKNAKTVDRARELILDDKSINARCVRTLITDSTSQDSYERLPLSLIRWQDDSNRFDTGYYLNSLVNLDLLVLSLLDLKFPKDPMDKSMVLKFIKSINDSLGVDGKQVNDEGRSLTRFYDEDCCEDDEPSVPFARLPEPYLNSAVQGFEVNFRPWMMKVFLAFKPYSDILNYARKYDLIEGSFAGFQAQTKKNRTKIKNRELSLDNNWYDEQILRHERSISGMKEDQWPFKAIFQKALMRLCKIVEFDNKGNDQKLGNIDDLISFFNDLYVKVLLQVSVDIPRHSYKLWTFIALNPVGGKIKIAKTVEDKILSVLALWYFTQRKLLLDQQSGVALLSRRKLLNFFAATKNSTEWPNAKDYYGLLYKGFDSPALHGGKDAEVTDKEKDDNVKSRFSDILVLPFAEYSQERERVDEE